MDEAGQVTPENGGAVFALADRSVVIGDTAQLEPVWNVPKHTDDGNLLRFGVAKNVEAIPSAHCLGISASSGSLMQRALTTSAVEENGAAGVFLSEHRRSVPELVRFINTLSYNQKLQPMRAEPAERILPTFGYAHIRGRSAQSGRSRLNRLEAEAIVGWIRDHQRQLESWYKLPLAEILAVITPFTSQTLYLKSMLLDRYPSMVIGTVGSLQGAERPVVIFSSVYDHSQPFNYAFDRTPNLLNVAVSRAKDSFLVFGNMESFRRGGNLPSTVLASFLFADSANELVDVELGSAADSGESSLSRLSTPEEHEQALTQAFQNANQRVLIVAPSISITTVSAAHLEKQISEAVARGVSVTIYTDSDLDIDLATGGLRGSAEEGRARLARAGASLLVVERVHSKALAIDDTDIFQGHHSWLSSTEARSVGGKTQPVSVHVTGEDAQRAIAQLEEDLSSRATSAHP